MQLGYPVDFVQSCLDHVAIFYVQFRVGLVQNYLDLEYKSIELS